MTKWTPTLLRKGDVDIYITLIDRNEIESKVLGLYSSCRYMSYDILIPIMQALVSMILTGAEEYEL